MLNTKILFNWTPTAFDYTLKDQFLERLSLEGIDPYWIEVRNPSHNLAFVIDSKGWHRDSETPESEFVIWSNRNPTEVQLMMVRYWKEPRTEMRF